MLTVKIQLKQLILKFRVCEDSNHQGKSPFSCLSGLFVFGFHIPSYSAYCILMDLFDAISSQSHTNILIMFTKQEKDNKKTLSNSRNNLAEKSQVYLYQYIDIIRLSKNNTTLKCKCDCCQKRQKMCCIQIRRGHPSKRSVI